jgi:hypothetical protein
MKKSSAITGKAGTSGGALGVVVSSQRIPRDKLACVISVKPP